MAKTAASDVWKTTIKAEGNGWVDVVALMTDIAESWFKGQALQMGDDGAWIKYATGVADFIGGFCVLSEPKVDDDTYGLVRKFGAEVLHNQKLAGTYKCGDGVVQTAAGTWTLFDKDTAGHMLMRPGIVCGPEDRITGGVLKGIDDAFTATEPVDILF